MIFLKLHFAVLFHQVVIVFVEQLLRVFFRFCKLLVALLGVSAQLPLELVVQFPLQVVRIGNFPDGRQEMDVETLEFPQRRKCRSCVRRIFAVEIKRIRVQLSVEIIFSELVGSFLSFFLNKKLYVIVWRLWKKFHNFTNKT